MRRTAHAAIDMLTAQHAVATRLCSASQAMRRSLAAALIAGLVSPVNLAAQVVQLPTYSSFSTNTTVVVPDHGGSHVGSLNRASSGRNEFGGFSRRRVATGSERAAAGVDVAVTIHDMQELDAAHRRTAPSALRDHFAGLSLTGPRVQSLNEIARTRAHAATAAQRELDQIMARAQAAESAGKPNVARVYYKSVARRAAGHLKQQAQGNLQRLNQTAAAR